LQPTMVRRRSQFSAFFTHRTNFWPRFPRAQKVLDAGSQSILFPSRHSTSPARDMKNVRAPAKYVNLAHLQKAQ
jgi:hypothetical protein